MSNSNALELQILMKKKHNLFHWELPGSNKSTNYYDAFCTHWQYLQKKSKNVTRHSNYKNSSHISTVGKDCFHAHSNSWSFGGFNK